MFQDTIIKFNFRPEKTILLRRVNGGTNGGQGCSLGIGSFCLFNFAKGTTSISVARFPRGFKKNRERERLCEDFDTLFFFSSSFDSRGSI